MRFKIPIYSVNSLKELLSTLEELNTDKELILWKIEQFLFSANNKEGV